jgi:hypothetical protein
VELALRAVRGQVISKTGKSIGTSENAAPLADATKAFTELPADRQAMVTSVAKALGTSVDNLKASNWQLTDDQVKTLKSMRSQGLKPLTIPTEHPLAAFGDQAHYPLADINGANARVAGVGGAKDLWGKLPEKDQQAHRERVAARATTPGTAPSNLSPEDTTIREQALDKLAAAAGVDRDVFVDNGLELTPKQQAAVRNAAKTDPSVLEAAKTLAEFRARETREAPEVAVGERNAKQSGEVTVAPKTADDLQFEHDMMQKMLGAHLKQQQSAILDRLPAWRQARIGESNPSKLAQDIAALPKELRKGIPKELYADEHLKAKTPVGTQEPKPVQTAETAKVGQTPESAQAAGLADKIEKLVTDTRTKHGEETFGAFQKLLDAVDEKYPTRETADKVLYQLAKRYSDNLDKKTGDPLGEVLKVLERLPEDKGGATLYSNPIPAIWERLFNRNRVPVGKEPFFDRTSVVPEGPIVDLTHSLEGRPTAPPAEQFKAYLANETASFLKTWQEMPGTMKERWAAADSFFQKMKNAYMERPGLSAVDVSMGIRALHLNQASYELSDFVKKMNANHPDRLRRSAMAAWEEAGGGRLPDNEVAEMVQNQAYDFAGTSELDRSHKAFNKIYSAAADLTDAEKQTVKDYREYRARMEAREAELGLNHDAQLDYLQHIWSRDNFVTKSLAAIQSGRGFGTTATFERMRKFDTYFEGIQKGYKPNSLDMTYLISARAMASARVIANREMMKFLETQTMPDGSKAVAPEGMGTFQQPRKKSLGRL